MNQILKSGKVNNEASILWLDVVEENSTYVIDMNIPLGAILLGIEWFDHDGERQRATMRIDPEPTSTMLN